MQGFGSGVPGPVRTIIWGTRPHANHETLPNLLTEGKKSTIRGITPNARPVAHWNHKQKKEWTTKHGLDVVEGLLQA